MSRYSTANVTRRRGHGGVVHRAEYVIFATGAEDNPTYTWVSSSATSCEDEAVAENTARETVDEVETIGSGEEEDDELGSVASSSFDFVEKPAMRFRTTITMGDSETGSGGIRYGTELKCMPNFACEDISKMDENTKMKYELSNGENFQRDVRQSEPILGRDSGADYQLHSACMSTGFKSFSINVTNAPPPASHWSAPRDLRYVPNKHYVSTSSSEAATPCQKKYCSSYNISSPINSTYRENHTDIRVVGDPDSLRSSDSGLADITSPLLNTPVPGGAAAESDGSSNFERQCNCASPFDTTPYASGATDDKMYTSERTVETSIEQQEPVTFKSAMYAHWWLKTKIPVTALKTPADTSRFSSQTGKMNFTCVRVCSLCRCAFFFFCSMPDYLILIPHRVVLCTNAMPFFYSIMIAYYAFDCLIDLRNFELSHFAFACF